MSVFNRDLDYEVVCEDEIYRHQEAFEPYLDLLEGFDKSDFRWTVGSANRVKFILDSLQELDVIKITINPKHTPPPDEYRFGPHGWRVDVIHSGGIFGYILPAVRNNESVSVFAC